MSTPFRATRLCEFREDAFSVFSRKLIEEALDQTVKPLVPPKREEEKDHSE